MNIKAKLFPILSLLIVFSLTTKGQYRRRGETLQSPNGSKKNQSKKTVFTLSQFKGKWQEIERKERGNNTVVAFNDSIQLSFTDSNKVQTRTSMLSSMAMVGEAEIDQDNTLTAAADQYTIISVNEKELLLDDNENYIHRLQKVDSFWYEKLGRIEVKKDEFTTPIKAGLKDITGKWSVYRRQASPGSVSSNIKLIKYLTITGKKNETTASGSITFYQGESSQQLPCTVTLAGTAIKITAGSYIWDFSIYQADGNNFVFGKNGLMYYCKNSP